MGVNRERILKTFLELVKIPSPSRRERGVAEYIKARAVTLGYTVREDDAAEKVGGECGNLLIRIPGNTPGAPALLIGAHMDTVETGEQVIEPVVDEAGNIRSAGDTIVGADDKTGVAVMLELLQLIKEDRLPHGDLLLVFSVVEEKEALGACALNPQEYAGCDAGIALDHSEPSSIIIGAPAKLTIKITVHGHGGHAAFPERSINAAHVLARTVARLPSKRLDEFSTANLGIIRAGTAVNVIPGTAYAEYEIRSHDEDLLDFHLNRALTTIEASVREARIFISRAVSGGIGDDSAGQEPLRKATVEVDVVNCYESYRIGEDSLPYRLLRKAVGASGLDFSATLAQGGSDANIYNAQGLPSVVLGCGMHGVHCSNERASLDEMCRCTEVLARAIGG